MQQIIGTPTGQKTILDVPIIEGFYRRKHLIVIKIEPLITSHSLEGFGDWSAKHTTSSRGITFDRRERTGRARVFLFHLPFI